MTTTPEMNRRRMQMRASCGHVMALLDAAFGYRSNVKRLLNQMALLHREILGVLDRMEIQCQIWVAPIESPEVEPADPAPAMETPEERIASFASGVGRMLNIDTSRVSDPLEKLDVVEKALKKLLTRPISEIERDTFSGRRVRKRRSLWKERDGVTSRNRPLMPRRAARSRTSGTSRLELGRMGRPPLANSKLVSSASSDGG
jgi:hypothetical protein